MRLALLVAALACAGADPPPPPRQCKPPDPALEAELLRAVEPPAEDAAESVIEARVRIARRQARAIAAYLEEHAPASAELETHRLALLDAADLWERDLRTARAEEWAKRARWRADQEAHRAAQAPPPEPAPPTPPPPVEVPRATAPPFRCSRCGAKPGRWCRGPNGGPVPTLHPERLRARSKS